MKFDSVALVKEADGLGRGRDATVYIYQVWADGRDKPLPGCITLTTSRYLDDFRLLRWTLHTDLPHLAPRISQWRSIGSEHVKGNIEEWLGREHLAPVLIPTGPRLAGPARRVRLDVASSDLPLLEANYVATARYPTPSGWDAILDWLGVGMTDADAGWNHYLPVATWSRKPLCEFTRALARARERGQVSLHVLADLDALRQADPLPAGLERKFVSAEGSFLDAIEEEPWQRGHWYGWIDWLQEQPSFHLRQHGQRLAAWLATEPPAPDALGLSDDPDKGRGHPVRSSS